MFCAKKTFGQHTNLCSEEHCAIRDSRTSNFIHQSADVIDLKAPLLVILFVCAFSIWSCLQLSGNLVRLDVSQNKIGDKGIKKLLTVMRNSCKQLQVLNAHTNNITSKGALRSITSADWWMK